MDICCDYTTTGETVAAHHVLLVGTQLSGQYGCSMLQVHRCTLCRHHTVCFQGRRHTCLVRGMAFLRPTIHCASCSCQVYRAVHTCRMGPVSVLLPVAQACINISLECELLSSACLTRVLAVGCCHCLHMCYHTGRSFPWNGTTELRLPLSGGLAGAGVYDAPTHVDCRQ